MTPSLAVVYGHNYYSQKNILIKYVDDLRITPNHIGNAKDALQNDAEEIIKWREDHNILANP